MVDMETVAASLTELLTNYAVTRDELELVMTGPHDGGPAGDGLYPVTTAAGVTILVPSLLKLLASGVVIDPALLAPLVTRAEKAGVQVQALIGLAKDQADRASAQVPLAAAQVALANTARTGADTARTATEQTRDQFASTVATAIASVQTAANVYTTVEAGLAATAEGKPFDVSSPGDAFATRYLKTNGAAQLVNTLPSRAALDRIGRSVPAQAQGDNALSINQALNDPLVRAVYLPSGNTGIDTSIRVPDGKAIYGQGRDVTTITRRNSNFEGDGTTNGAVIHTIRGARGVHVRGLTAKGTDFTNKMTGIWLDGAIDMVVEEVDVLNAGYAFFIQEYARGCLVRRCRSYNSNTDFEVTQGYDSTFEDCERGDGDGNNPRLGEAWCIVHLGSRGITFRRIKGSGTGQPVTISANDVNNDPLGGLIDRILVDDSDFTSTNGSTAMLMNSYNNLNIGTVRVRNTRMKLTGIIGVVERGNLVLEGGSIETTSQEGFLLEPGTSLVSRNVDVTVRAEPGAVGRVYDATKAPIEVHGGSVTATTGTIEIGNGTGLYVSPHTRFVTPRAIYGPETGRSVTYTWTQDVPLAGTQEAVIGDGTSQPRAQFEAAAGGRYRLRLTGRMKKAGVGGSLRLHLFGIAAASAVGTVAVEKADGIFVTMLGGFFGEPGFFMPDVPAGSVRNFAMDIEVTANGGDVAAIYGTDDVVLLAGARITIERLS